MPANDYYDSTNVPATGAAVTSATLRAEYNLIESAFNKCPPLTGNGGKVVIVNAGGTALTADSFASLASGALALKANVADAIFTGLTTVPQLKLDTTTLTVSGAELNFVDGVTSAIQTQLDAKASNTGTAAGLTAGNVKLAWTIKTTTYTAVAGDALMANTTSSAFTITLPATPTANDTVDIADYAGTFGTNNLTIGRNSSKIMGLSEDMVVSSNNARFRLVYIDTTVGWRIV